MNTIGEILAARTGRRRETIIRSVQTVASGDIPGIGFVVDRWLRSKAAEFDVPTEATPSILRTGTLERDGLSLVTIREGDAYAARLSHVDAHVDDTSWIVNIGIAGLSADAVGVDVTLEADVALHASAPRSAPNFLKRLAADVGITDGASKVGDRPSACAGPSGFAGLVEFLQSPDRRLPVVLLTPPFALPPVVLAQTLVPFAHVVTMDNETTWLLTARLGDGYRTFDGAVRVFAPGFTLLDDPRVHTRWTRPTIESIERRDAKGGFRAALTRDVFAAVTAHVAEVPLLNVDALELRRYRREQALPRVLEATLPVVSEAIPDADDVVISLATSEDGLTGVTLVTRPRDEAAAAIIASQEETIERQRREATELQSENAALSQMYLDLEARYLALTEGAEMGVNLAALQALGSELPEAAAIVAAIGDLSRALTGIVERAHAARTAQVDLHADLQRERSRSAWLQSRVDSAIASDASVGAKLPEYDDPNGLARWIETRYEGRVILHPRALQWWERGAYDDRSRLTGALDLLGNEYHAIRTRTADDTDAFERYNGRRESLGLRESGAISDSEIGKFRADYEVMYDGVPRRIDNHLRNLGNSTEATRCLAIYFFWDDVRNAVVLCALPGHLPNRLSP